MTRLGAYSARLYWHPLVNLVCGSFLVPDQARWLFYRLFGIQADPCSISRGCFFGGGNVRIGSRTFINCGAFFDPSARIEIGSHCSFGMHVTLITSTHEVGEGQKRAGAAVSRPIAIGDGTWLGARVTVLPGVTIGSGSIVAAGSLVTSDCEPNALYAGVPAKFVKRLA